MKKNALHLFVPKNGFLPLKICFSGNKILDQHLNANSKKHCLQNFASIFLLFLPFSAFCTKNVKKAYFDQRLEWAAPNRWSKNTIGNQWLQPASNLLHNATEALKLFKGILTVIWCCYFDFIATNFLCHVYLEWGILVSYGNLWGKISCRSTARRFSTGFSRLLANLSSVWSKSSKVLMF